VVLTNVGVRLKGMGSFRSVDEKPSLTVKFDEFVPVQEYRGLTRLMFNNSVQDPTFLAEFLAMGLFHDAGLPTPQVTYARVQFNGRDLGLYVVIEAMNKRFLKQHFKSSKGNLYEGYLLDIDAPLDQDNGETSDQRDVQALLGACTISDPAERFRQLSRVLDVDRFISFVAMEMLIGHWDGYAIHTNNYRIYHDPTSDKMVFITHGLDGPFGARTSPSTRQ
jgi:spore coat protein CotH